MDKQLVFPANFIWGATTSAYQIEGAIHQDGREDSIWDVFCRIPGKIQGGQSGEIAADHYNLWKKDVALMAAMGIKSYRFSLAWPRIVPNGRINKLGLAFYDRVIDELLKNGIEPAITLYHWDLPQSLEEKGGWQSRDIIQDFVDYAEIAFNHYSDRVNIWMTHNEPAVVSAAGYRTGVHAPGIKDDNTAMVVAHHLLLSHGVALKHLRALAPIGFKGKFGIALNVSAIHPENSLSAEDKAAAKKLASIRNDFFLDALFKGTYPKEILEKYPILKEVVKDGDMDMICGKLDFLGVNYYTKTVVKANKANGTIEPVIVPAVPNAYSSMWNYYPAGLGEVLQDICDRYHPAEILITENGTAINDIISETGNVQDDGRIRYFQDHLEVLHQKIQAGLPITGYYAWSLLDNFEWNYGYQKRFGLIYVDYKTQRRIIKESGHWYQKLIKANAL